MPGHETQADIHCSHCGRFVGALTRCPHCGARMSKRMSLRAIRVFAMALATIGLGLLYLMSTHRQIPSIKIDEIKPTMNFAYVRVAGTIQGETRLFKQGGKVRSLTFYVDDGSGEIPVTAYRAQAEELAAEGRIPRAGDRVEAAGSLSVSADDNILMRLQAPDQLTIIRTDLPITRLAEIDESLLGESLAVEGRILKIQPPLPDSKLPWTLDLEDESGSRTLTFWDDAYAEIADKVLLAPGAIVRARVSVSSYRGKLQLKLGPGAALEFPQAPAAQFLAAGLGVPAGRPRKVEVKDLRPEMAGQQVRLSGRVLSIKAPAADSKEPYEVVLQEGDASVQVVYWDKVAARLTQSKPMIGVLMQVEGMVSVFKDVLQIKVNRADKIVLLDVMPVSEPVVRQSQVMEIGSIGRDRIGSVCTVRGKLGEPQSIRSGVQYSLTDDTGSIVVLLWDKKVQGSNRNALKAGMTIVATGELVDYKGVLELTLPSDQALQLEE
ncbi:MAG: hypothetical protein A2X46_04760 [Lentisphaerae bacterium GWF2_57_35]|nr:MAG: hypothetical protein A2X46_04760 [Lentisphaerae bacterium GWF2_57_35]